MPDLSDALLEDSSGTILALDVTAGAKSDLFPAGYNEWRHSIGCRVTAPALEGRANKAIMKLVAKTLGVPVPSVEIHTGSTSSQKKILIHSISKQEILHRLSGKLD
jgi:hypothetical protein